eukprot:363222-Chlamydomonas_euryale.AAC.7
MHTTFNTSAPSLDSTTAPGPAGRLRAKLQHPTTIGEIFVTTKMLVTLAGWNRTKFWSAVIASCVVKTRLAQTRLGSEIRTSHPGWIAQLLPGAGWREHLGPSDSLVRSRIGLNRQCSI